MALHPTIFQIYFRIDDQRFVVCDVLGLALFEGTYGEVEDWLDQYDNHPDSIVGSLADDNVVFLRSLGSFQRPRKPID